MRLLRTALAQVNTTVGDLDGNAALVLKGLDAARAAKADLVVFPELTITGYPPEDLLLRPQFITDNLAVLHRIVRKVKGIAAVIGFVTGTRISSTPPRSLPTAGFWPPSTRATRRTTGCSMRTAISRP